MSMTGVNISKYLKFKVTWDVFPKHLQITKLKKKIK